VLKRSALGSGHRGTVAQWREMPEKYPPYQTCHRRFQQWVRNGKLEEALKRLARHLHQRGKLNLEEAFVDATFASAKKGASLLAPPVAARAPRSSLSPLVTVFLSPYLSTALRRPSASLWSTAEVVHPREEPLHLPTLSVAAQLAPILAPASIAPVGRDHLDVVVVPERAIERVRVVGFVADEPGGELVEEASSQNVPRTMRFALSL